MPPALSLMAPHASLRVGLRRAAEPCVQVDCAPRWQRDRPVRVVRLLLDVGDDAVRLRRCSRLSPRAHAASVSIGYFCTGLPRAARPLRSFARTCSRRSACRSLTDGCGTIGRMCAGRARPATLMVGPECRRTTRCTCTIGGANRTTIRARNALQRYTRRGSCPPHSRRVRFPSDDTQEEPSIQNLLFTTVAVSEQQGEASEIRSLLGTSGMHPKRGRRAGGRLLHAGMPYRRCVCVVCAQSSAPCCIVPH